MTLATSIDVLSRCRNCWVKEDCVTFGCACSQIPSVIMRVFLLLVQSTFYENPKLLAQCSDVAGLTFIPRAYSTVNLKEKQNIYILIISDLRSVLRASKFSELKLIEIVILWVYYTIPYDFSLFRHFRSITFYLFKLLCLAKDHWRGFSSRNAHMVHIVN